MFKLTHNVHAHYRALAILVAASLVLWSAGMYSKTAQAANLVELSNTLTDTAPEAQSGHQFRFIVPAGSDISGDITIEFESGFGDVDAVDSGDVTVTVAGSPQTPTGVSSSGSIVTIEGITATSSEVVTIDIASGVVTNPSISDPSESFEFRVTTQTTENGDDTGRTRVVIIDTVLVTADIDTVFEFTITGLNEGSPFFASSTTGSTTANTVPFGTLSPGVQYLLAQQLNVETNAGNGFVVTVESDSDGDLVSATGADINQFQDANPVSTPTAWTSPSNIVTDPDTWGHWGIASNDQSLDESSFGENFSANEFVAVTGSPVPVFYHDGPADNSTQDIGQILVGYTIEVTALQEAAEDYQTTLTYIATPTF